INSLFLLVVLLLQDLAGRSIRESLQALKRQLQEKQLAEAALVKSEGKHRETVNSLPYCVFEMDLDGGITFVNQTGLQWFGYSEAEILAGMNVFQILVSADGARARENLDRLLNGQDLSYREYQVRCKDGTVFTCMIRSRLLLEGGRPVAVQGSLIDLRERMQAQDALQARENMLSSILRAAPTGIGVVCKRVITLVNSRICEMTGWTQEELIGESSRRLYPSDADFDYVGKEKYRQIAERGTGTVETSWQCKDGRIIDVLLSSTPIDPADLSAGVTFTALDITESKRAERALRMSNQFISSLLRAIPVAVFFKDKEGKYTGCNDAFTEILGVTSDEIKGKTVHEIWPGELAATYHQKDLELMKEKKHQVYEFQVKDKNGKLRPVIYAKDVFIDANGEVGGLVGAFLDISDRKLGEEKLLESERRYRALFEAANDAIFVMKGDLFFDCNSKTLEMFACTREQIINASPSRFSPPLQADGRRSSEKAQEKIKAAYAGQPQFFEWTHLRAGGTPFLAEVSLTRIDLAADVFLLAMVRDISERKKLEEQLLQAQKMEAIGILAGGVAHDFNNILSTIVGYGSLLQMKLPEQEPLTGYIERILAASDRAASLTGSLLAFSRKQEVELQPVDINETIYGFHKVLARLIGEDIDFSLNLSSDVLVVDADVRQIEQVLMNLVNNSRDAMPRGGRLTIGTAIRVLEADSAGIPRGSYAAFAVADTGTGMPADIQARIFEPFFTTKDVGKGTGLGLAIAYGIVKKHGGFIHVASAPGQGTTVTVHLPLRTRPGPAAGKGETDDIPGGSETILLIEDDPAVRQVTRSMLEEFGYTVLEATDGISAQYVFQENRQRIDLVVCDLLMPRLNGRETLAGLRKMKESLPAIFISGYTADIIAKKGLVETGIHLLMKPLNPRSLLQKVRSVLDEG
ncbi:MAG: PAS domain S-box protein, partial [Acidobacteria bacterium]|nr:PAS domain S-box protein [Acidobacteriota bacterium]